MVDDRADDPEGVILQLLAAGPMLAPEFRRLAHARGVPVKVIPLAAKAVGARPRRVGRPGRGGWVWELAQDRPPSYGIISRKGRKGFHAKFLFHGRAIQQKLADDFDTAKARLAELLAKLEAERAAEAARPRAAQASRTRTKKTLHEQLRELARGQSRDVARKLYRAAKDIEANEKGQQP